MQNVSQVLTHGRTELAKVIVGQEELINQCLLTVLCGGHALLEGVPGIAKTLVIKSFARLFTLEFRRVQCTSDLMPADIIGSNVLNLATSAFALHRGPLFTDLLLADEVNRMPPRTQAAVLEAMEERQITIDGITHHLSQFFTVFATQNPIEFEGTYPLPEAQLDRFLLKIKVGYPSAENEVTILQHHHEGFDAHNLDAANLSALPEDVLAQARAEIRTVKVEPALFRYIVEIIRRTRGWPALALGASPRAAISLMIVAKATAALEGRDYIIPDDVKSSALPVLRHRVMMKPEAELEGLDSDRVLGEIVGSVEVPEIMPTQLAPEPMSVRAKSAKRLSFAFGRRFFLVTLLGLLWAVPAFWDVRFLLVMAAWSACALIAWAVDLARLPRPERLVVERSWAGAPSLSNNTQVTLEVRNQSRVYVSCSVIDDAPGSLIAEPPSLQINAPANDSGFASYTARPLERGDVTLGEVYLRYQSGSHFAERWARADLRQTVRVFPDLEDAKRQNIYLSRARQIELERRLIRQRGVGREFESLREYQPGDEFRNICWTATARRGKHVTKLFQVERSQAVWIVLDAGRLLRARVGELSKLDLAVNAALSLAQIALYSGDRTGLIVYGRDIQQRVGLGRGLTHMRAIMEALASSHEEVAEADHLRAASVLLQLQKQRALIIWVTDLADTSMTPEVIESASRILSKHLLLFTVIAQTDLNELAVRAPADAAEMYEIAAAQEMVLRREGLIGKVRNKGALALEIAPSRLTSDLVNQYLKVKERNLI